MSATDNTHQGERFECAFPEDHHWDGDGLKPWERGQPSNDSQPTDADAPSRLHEQVSKAHVVRSALA